MHAPNEVQREMCEFRLPKKKEPPILPKSAAKRRYCLDGPERRERKGGGGEGEGESTPAPPQVFMDIDEVRVLLCLH